MHAWVTEFFARLHNADLDHEADHERLVRIARLAPRGEAFGGFVLSERLDHLAHLLFGGRTPHPRGR